MEVQRTHTHTHTHTQFMCANSFTQSLCRLKCVPQLPIIVWVHRGGTPTGGAVFSANYSFIYSLACGHFQMTLARLLIHRIKSQCVCVGCGCVWGSVWPCHAVLLRGISPNLLYSTLTHFQYYICILIDKDSWEHFLYCHKTNHVVRLDSSMILSTCAVVPNWLFKSLRQWLFSKLTAEYADCETTVAVCPFHHLIQNNLSIIFAFHHVWFPKMPQSLPIFNLQRSKNPCRDIEASPL